MLEEKIAEAENCIRTKKRVVNEKLEDGRHIVLCLMKKYNISVSLKTQGWINNKLASLTGTDTLFILTIINENSVDYAAGIQAA